MPEMFSPDIIADRVRGMLAGYPFITEETLPILPLCQSLRADPR